MVVSQKLIQQDKDGIKASFEILRLIKKMRVKMTKLEEIISCIKGNSVYVQMHNFPDP
ncbi:MAG: hypothetical protein ACLT33_03340 [Lachnospira pectinoschiza]